MKTELTTSGDSPVFIKQYKGAIVLHHGNSVITLFEPETIELRNFLNQLDLGDKSLVAELVESLQQCIDAWDKKGISQQAAYGFAKDILNKAKGDK